jgi:beta-lactamase superfamily II metal-dependent hydrolase
MSLRAHFLNVGDGDCTIVELPDGTVMMIDVHNARAVHREARPEFVNPLQYFADSGLGSSIFRYVQTHPEMDHMDGFADVVSNLSITNFWDTSNNRAKPDDFGYGYREEDWDAYASWHNSSSTKFRFRSVDSVKLTSGGTFPYKLYVVSPTQELINQANETEEWNLLSYVVLLQYGAFKLLLGGDASDSAWEDIYNWISESDDVSRFLANITIFRVSHHGSTSSYCGFDILNALTPDKIIISKAPSQDASAYGNYYNWFDGADNLFLTSQGTVVVNYNLQRNEYWIQQTT